MRARSPRHRRQAPFDCKFPLRHSCHRAQSSSASRLTAGAFGVSLREFPCSASLWCVWGPAPFDSTGWPSQQQNNQHQNRRDENRNYECSKISNSSLAAVRRGNETECEIGDDAKSNSQNNHFSYPGSALTGTRAPTAIAVFILPAKNGTVNPLAPPTPPKPVLFQFPPDRRDGRVLRFQPVRRATRAINRVAPFRHDTF
jgi:hypothetical protein